MIPALAALAPSVISRTALGLGAATAPSDRITLGFIGIGCMGQGHLAHLLTYPDVQVLAVCDVDTWRRENASGPSMTPTPGDAPRATIQDAPPTSISLMCSRATTSMRW